MTKPKRSASDFSHQRNVSNNRSTKNKPKESERGSRLLNGAISKRKTMSKLGSSATMLLQQKVGNESEPLAKQKLRHSDTPKTSDERKRNAKHSAAPQRKLDANAIAAEPLLLLSGLRLTPMCNEVWTRNSIVC
jgi:hypothetical protein